MKVEGAQVIWPFGIVATLSSYTRCRVLYSKAVRCYDCRKAVKHTLKYIPGIVNLLRAECPNCGAVTKFKRWKKKPIDIWDFKTDTRRPVQLEDLL